VSALPEIALFQMRVDVNAKTLNPSIGVVQKRGSGSERVFRSSAHESVERCKGLGVPDFIRASVDT
jgi:hypothetical protein